MTGDPQRPQGHLPQGDDRRVAARLRAARPRSSRPCSRATRDAGPGARRNERVFLVHLGFAYQQLERYADAAAAFAARARRAATRPTRTCSAPRRGALLAKENDEALAAVKKARARFPETSSSPASRRRSCARGRARVRADTLVEAMRTKAPRTRRCSPGWPTSTAAASGSPRPRRPCARPQGRPAQPRRALPARRGARAAEAPRRGGGGLPRGARPSSPTRRPVLNYLGYMNADRGVRVDEAVGLIEKAVEPRPGERRLSRQPRLGALPAGSARARRDRGPQGRRAGPEANAVVLDHLGDVLSRRGRVAEALAYWQHALVGEDEEGELDRPRWRSRSVRPRALGSAAGHDGADPGRRPGPRGPAVGRRLGPWRPALLALARSSPRPAPAPSVPLRPASPRCGAVAVLRPGAARVGARSQRRGRSRALVGSAVPTRCASSSPGPRARACRRGPRRPPDGRAPARARVSRAGGAAGRSRGPPRRRAGAGRADGRARRSAPGGPARLPADWGAALPAPRSRRCSATGRGCEATVDEADARAGVSPAAFVAPPHDGYREVDADEARRLLGGADGGEGKAARPRGRELHVRSYAKVNLGLEVLGVRDDGYHELRTLFQTIDLHDDIVLRPLGPDAGRPRHLRPPARPDRRDEPGRPGRVRPAALRRAAPGRRDRDPEAHPGGRRARGWVEQRGRGAPGSRPAAGSLGLGPPGLHRLAARLGADVPYFLVGRDGPRHRPRRRGLPAPRADPGPRRGRRRGHPRVHDGRLRAVWTQV